MAILQMRCNKPLFMKGRYRCFSISHPVGWAQLKEGLLKNFRPHKTLSEVSISNVHGACLETLETIRYPSIPIIGTFTWPRIGFGNKRLEGIKLKINWAFVRIVAWLFRQFETVYYDMKQLIMEIGFFAIIYHGFYLIIEIKYLNYCTVSHHLVTFVGKVHLLL